MPLHSEQTHLLTLLWIEKVENCSLEVILGESLCHPINSSLPSHKSQYSLENHRSISLIPAFSSADVRTSYASLHQSLTSFTTHPHFPCPARRASDSACVLDVCLCRFMNPVHLTKFWERHATVQLKPKAVLQYLLQLFFFWLFTFLVPSGCSVVTIDGTGMPSLCVLHTAHPVPWEAPRGRTAPPEASHKCPFSLLCC